MYAIMGSFLNRDALLPLIMRDMQNEESNLACSVLQLIAYMPQPILNVSSTCAQPIGDSVCPSLYLYEAGFCKQSKLCSLY